MPGSSSRREDLWWRLVMWQSYPTRQTCTSVLSVVSADCWLFPSHFQPPSNSGVHSSQRSFSEKIRNVIDFVYCQSIKLCTSSYSDRSVRAMSVMKFDKPCREPYCVGLTNTPRKRDSQSCRLESRHSLASVQGAAGVEGWQHSRPGSGHGPLTRAATRGWVRMRRTRRYCCWSRMSTSCPPGWSHSSKLSLTSLRKISSQALEVIKNLSFGEYNFHNDTL